MIFKRVIPEYAEENRLSTGRRVLLLLHLDFTLITSLLLLAVVGLIVLYSASDQNMELLAKQSLRLLLGFVVMFLVAQLTPETIKYWSPWLFVIGFIMLVLVLVVGDVGKGAQRWLSLGVLSFQPSELMKIALPMLIAWYFADTVLPPSFMRVIGACLLFAVPTYVVALQPDLGTAMVLAASGTFVLFLAGLRWRTIIIGILLLIPTLWIMWHYGMHDYQRKRVITFLNPETDPLGAGYHIIQSTIAIGSGGIYGKGWLEGTQSHLDFLPERRTDFIFAVFSEEFGFLGTLLLLLLYAVIIGRGIVIATQAQSTYTRLLAGSIILTFFVYVFINIGMVSGLLPVVGIPLPLISFGGTSLVTIMASFGILMSIATHRKLVST
ncbi:MAG: rod shape-determining protein RodA [Gammaproteobacteria bacterium]|nr:rod shape-determining protein RodA [Gammaproteobacteria bacterium]